MAISKLTSADFKREVEDRDGRVSSTSMRTGVDPAARWPPPWRSFPPSGRAPFAS